MVNVDFNCAKKGYDGERCGSGTGTAIKTVI